MIGEADGDYRIQGERVRLVPPDRAIHLENALAWLNDPEVTATLKLNLGITRRQEQEFFEHIENRRGTDFVWAILDQADTHIGFIGLESINWRNRWGFGRAVLSATVRHGVKGLRPTPSA